MTAATITIGRAGLTDEVSRALIGALNAELSALYPEPGATHFELGGQEVAGGHGTFLVVYRDGTPVGCGALRRLDADTGELKRMYVSPALRRIPPLAGDERLSGQGPLRRRSGARPAEPSRQRRRPHEWARRVPRVDP
jgi:hypothetical protein